MRTFWRVLIGHLVHAPRWLRTRISRWWSGGPLDDDFEHFERLLDRRMHTLQHAMGKLKESEPRLGKKAKADVLFRLAAVDLFVEKAQAVLTARARRMSRAGI